MIFGRLEFTDAEIEMGIREARSLTCMEYMQGSLVRHYYK